MQSEPESLDSELDEPDKIILIKQEPNLLIIEESTQVI